MAARTPLKPRCAACSPRILAGFGALTGGLLLLAPGHFFRIPLALLGRAKAGTRAVTAAAHATYLRASKPGWSKNDV